jgi:predicted N-formylglutamate amidohydrolase
MRRAGAGSTAVAGKAGGREPGGILLTCEHASNAVPAPHRPLFARRQGVLATHRAFDIGARTVARAMARSLGAPLHEGGITRLLVDLNRSVGHRDLHSEFTQPLTRAERAALVARWHVPFRDAALGSLRALLALGPVTHLSIHSFTPALDGTPRTCDIGLLYDPRRAGEQALALRLQAALATVAPQWRVRRNYPYRGAADGHATLLRRRFGPRSYVALEIEFNQALLRTPAAARAAAATFMAGLQLGRPGRGVRARG